MKCSGNTLSFWNKHATKSLPGPLVKFEKKKKKKSRLFAAGFEKWIIVCSRVGASMVILFTQRPEFKIKQS